MKRPKISVCLASYNGEKFIKDQISSILVQLEAEDEIVISDDSSTDETINIIQSFADSRLKVISNQNFKSPIYNFENALKNATGDIIFLADQDDLWEKDKVKIVSKTLIDYDLVVTDCKIIDASNQTLHASFFELNNSKSGFVNNLISNSYLGCCMAFKKEVLNIALPFPKNIPMHDVWLGFVGEVFFKIILLDKQLISYRRHGFNASSAAEKSKNSFTTKLYFRLITIWEISKLYFFKKFKGSKITKTDR